MSYLRKSTTLILVLLLLVVMGVFSFSIYFYERSLTGLNEQIYAKDIAIKSLGRQIDGLEKNLTFLGDILSIQLIREENLSGQYVEIKSAKDTLQNMNEQLYAELEETQENLSMTLDELALLREDYVELEEDYNVTSDELEKALDDIGAVCDAAENLNVSVCEDYT